ncbi:MAG: ABC transporter ATP-binding protein [Pseudomonadota bacterium]
MAPATPAIAARDLHVHFGHGEDMVTAVDGVGFEVPEGGTFGLIGESGCGKSTVLRAASGLNPHYEGSISVQGREVQSHLDPTFYKTVQMVFQDPYGSLHPRKMVHSVLREPLQIHGIGEQEDRIHHVLDVVGLGADFAFRYPHQLSGGQRQRVAIARCLIVEPKILLLDEPTSALDVSVQAEILNLLKRLQRDHGLTFLMVSHDLAVVAHLCSQIAVMTEGRIVEEMEADVVRAGRPAHPYTRELLQSSKTYREVGASA